MENAIYCTAIRSGRKSVQRITSMASAAPSRPRQSCRSARTVSWRRQRRSQARSRGGQRWRRQGRAQARPAAVRGLDHNTTPPPPQDDHIVFTPRRHSGPSGVRAHKATAARCRRRRLRSLPRRLGRFLQRTRPPSHGEVRGRRRSGVGGGHGSRSAAALVTLRLGATSGGRRESHSVSRSASIAATAAA